MKQSDLALKSHRVTVRMTGLMLANLRRLAGTTILVWLVSSTMGW